MSFLSRAFAVCREKTANTKPEMAAALIIVLGGVLLVQATTYSKQRRIQPDPFDAAVASSEATMESLLHSRERLQELETFSSSSREQASVLLAKIDTLLQDVRAKHEELLRQSK